MKIRWIALVSCIVLIACKNKNGQPASGDNTGSSSINPTSDSPAIEEKSPYLPVLDFIKGDIKNVETYAGAVLLKTSAGNKKDSVYINPEVFKNIANQFLLPELDSAYFNANFKEESLADPDKGELNFLYTATNDASPLRKVIVYVVSGQTAEKVGRIYLEKQTSSGDTTISSKLTWKTKEYLIVTESKQTSGGFSAVEIKRAIWEPSLFGLQ